MSPLTKAFVVLATILSVVMVTLTVAVVARVDDYRSQYQEVVAARDKAIKDDVKTRAEIQASLTAASMQAEKAKADLEAMAAQLKTSEDAQVQRGQEIANLLEQNARLAAAQASTAQLNEALSRRNEALNDQVAAVTGNITDVVAKFDQATRELVVVKADLDRLETDYRALAEQNQALEAQNAAQANKLQGYIEQGITPVPVVAEVDGAVTRVEKVSDQLTLVQVNVGTRDNVENDMQFTVFRGDEYVGTIKITRVDTDASVGELTLGGGVRAGDRIQSGRR